MKNLFDATIKNSIVFCVATCTIIIAGNDRANAADFSLIRSVTADITGSDTNNTPEMFGVSFDSRVFAHNEGTGFIRSITYNVGKKGTFNFDGSSSFNNSTKPVLGSLVGLQNSDISFDFDSNKPTSVTFNFKKNSFGVGDSFRFAAATQPHNGLNFTSGGDFGGSGKTLDEINPSENNIFMQISFEDKTIQGLATFTKVDSEQSTLTDLGISFVDDFSVPEPLTILATIGALGFLGVLEKLEKSNN